MRVTLSSKYVKRQLKDCFMGELVQVETGMHKGVLLLIIPRYAVTIDGSSRMWEMRGGEGIMTDFVRILQPGDSVTLTVE